MLKKYSGHQ